MESRIDDAGRNGIHSDIARGEIPREMTCEVVNERLRGAIRTGAGTAAIDACDRADIDDRPAGAFFHVRHRGLDRCHDCPDIEIEHRIDECIVHLEKRATRDK